ncbi:MAG TPA: tail fiber domain-containing protein, partial [Bacteroidia bacterium]|nr:tail fiber domain-containing protein [Bacteroidia bacterium]
ILSSNAIGDGVNVSGPSGNAVGYSIGGTAIGGSTMFLWHSGDPTSVYCGIQAGFTNSSTASAGPYYNTYTGYEAGEAFNGSGGQSNSFMGAYAGKSNTSGAQNCALGEKAFYTNTTGTENVAVGVQSVYLMAGGTADVGVGFWALHSDTTGTNTATGYDALMDNTKGSNNVANGYKALVDNTKGISNTGIGNESEFSNTLGNMNSGCGSSTIYSNQTGDSNIAMGNGALYSSTVSLNSSLGCYSMHYFTTGTYNAAMGYRAMEGTLTGSIGDSNVADGMLSMYSITKGNGNSAVGFRSGNSVTTDTDCLFLGARTDRAAIALWNAAAIGYHVIITKSNQMEVGNNNNNITMGLSNVAPSANYTRLELNTANGGGQYNVIATSTPPLYVNHQQGTGWSGLRFDDLTAVSTPGKNPSKGYLSVDSSGNVILVDTGTGGSGNGVGTCTTPTTFPVGVGNDGAIDLTTHLHNFYFEGISPGNPAKTDVIIGNNCGYTPLAKLDVLQQSPTYYNGSVGIRVENKDTGNCSDQVFGIQSIVTSKSLKGRRIAGYFAAPGHDTCRCSLFANPQQHAIFVPKGGGNVELGFSTFCGKPYTLNVNGTSWTYYGVWASDSTLKTSVSPITNALTMVNKLNGVSFQYVDSALTDTGMYGTHYGFIAQQVKRVLPNAVKTDADGIEGVAYTELIPWTVEAIKLEKKTNDSLRSTVDSLRYSLDSLRSAFKYYSSCFASLCEGRSQVHHHGGNGGSGDSNTTITNVQDVSLSSMADAPLLYQNIPNPFSGNTKINYYLPEGTQGATMVFYDNYGNQLKQVQLSQTGNGTLNINPENLTAGIYSYSLVVNGKIIDTKRMILQK